jgi:hypothetical protein
MRSMRFFHPMVRPRELSRVNLGTSARIAPALPTDYGLPEYETARQGARML